MRFDNGYFLLGLCNGSSIIRATLDPQADTVSFTEIVPAGVSAAGTILVSPDLTEHC